MYDDTEIAIFSTYGILFFLVNVRTVYVLQKHRSQFKSTFYSIFFICGLNECILYVLNNYMVRFPSIPFFYDNYFSMFTEWSRWHSPIYFLKRYCSYLINFTNIMLSLNRVTSIWRYASHDRFWQKTYRYWLFFAFSGTFVLSFQELFNKTRVARFEVNNITDFYFISDNYLNPIVSYNKGIIILISYFRIPHLWQFRLLQLLGELASSLTRLLSFSGDSVKL